VTGLSGYAWRCQLSFAGVPHCTSSAAGCGDHNNSSSIWCSKAGVECSRSQQPSSQQYCVIQLFLNHYTQLISV
jgi:hypothetical protein